jgi:hypothetical protein
VDAVILDGLLLELRPRLLGRYLSRPRLSGPTALSFEISGDRARLWLEAGRSTAGLYLLPREDARRLEALCDVQPAGAARQTLLLVRKHLDGAQVRGLRRVAGHRTVILEAAGALLVLAFGSSPSLFLVVEGAVLGSIGDGAPSWPLPQDLPDREWDRVEAAAVATAVRAARSEGQNPARAVLAVCPGLSKHLVRELDETPESFDRLRASLRTARPTLLRPGPRHEWHDADLVGAEAVALLPCALPSLAPTSLLHPPSWLEAAAIFLELLHRGERFRARRDRELQASRRQLRRLQKLEAHLVRDLAGLPDEAGLRRDAEALLASALPLPPGAGEVEVQDPYEPARTRRVKVDPALGGPKNADRLFTKARRIERARRQVEARLHEARSELQAARAREELVLEARDTEDLPPRSDGEAAGAFTAEAGGPRRYLSSRGLALLVGRGARENHHLTFTVARPDDLWLHARDVPGAHVILKDPEGRAGAEDLREAAEVAAFFSEARAEAQADVHVTRRKHVRPARGGPGRVVVGHSETLRVVPRDPEGRLRRR